MLKALLAVGRLIAEAHAKWRTRVAARRPMLVELSVVRERNDLLRLQYDLVCARLRRVPARCRPHYRAEERLTILWEAARRRLSVKATARAFLVSEATIVNWRKDVATDAARLVQAKPPVNKLPVTGCRRTRNSGHPV